MIFCIACYEESTLTLDAHVGEEKIQVCASHYKMMERWVELAKSSETMRRWFIRRYFPEKTSELINSNINEDMP